MADDWPKEIYHRQHKRANGGVVVVKPSDFTKLDRSPIIRAYFELSVTGLPTSVRAIRNTNKLPFHIFPRE
jgi:hypothetical protein